MSRMLVLCVGVATAAVAFVVGASISSGAAASLNATSQALTPYRTCVVTATPSSTTAVADASVRQASATSNFGTTTTMDVASASTANRRVYIWFDLAGCSPSIPSSATIRLATLRLYATGLPSVCRTLDIFKVGSSWSETAITWNNQPLGTSLNNPAASSRTDSFDIGTPGGCQNRIAGYVTDAIVTADVAAFVSGASNNYGWMIRDDSEGSSTTRTTTFSAKNLGTLAQAPQLVVTYVTAP
jgi:hypothetical protein